MTKKSDISKLSLDFLKAFPADKLVTDVIDIMKNYPHDAFAQKIHNTFTKNYELAKLYISGTTSRLAYLAKAYSQRAENFSDIAKENILYLTCSGPSGPSPLHFQNICEHMKKIKNAGILNKPLPVGKLYRSGPLSHLSEDHKLINEMSLSIQKVYYAILNNSLEILDPKDIALTGIIRAGGVIPSQNLIINTRFTKTKNIIGVFDHSAFAEYKYLLNIGFMPMPYLFEKQWHDELYIQFHNYDFLNSKLFVSNPDIDIIRITTIDSSRIWNDLNIQIQPKYEETIDPSPLFFGGELPFPESFYTAAYMASIQSLLNFTNVKKLFSDKKLPPINIAIYPREEFNEFLREIQSN